MGKIMLPVPVMHHMDASIVNMNSRTHNADVETIIP